MTNEEKKKILEAIGFVVKNDFEVTHPKHCDLKFVLNFINLEDLVHTIYSNGEHSGETKLKQKFKNLMGINL